MSKESRDKIETALNHIVETSNHMFLAHQELIAAGDKKTADRLNKLRDDFRSFRLEVTARFTENTDKQGRTRS